MIAQNPRRHRLLPVVRFRRRIRGDGPPSKRLRRVVWRSVATVLVLVVALTGVASATT
jgi:hypothetical protein